MRKTVDLVVIPAYNEESTIGGVVRSVRACTPNVDVVVVNDRSSDETVRVAEEAGALVISARGRHGYGAAMMAGFSHAREHRYEFVAAIDADGQHDSRSLGALFEGVRRCDVLSGSRYHPLSPPGVGAAPADRVRINHEFTDLINCITGWRLTDAFCGLKAYRVSALERLTLDEIGYGFPLQFWIQAWQAGLSVVEVPVEKIYLSVRRQFGNGLDDAEARRAYYRRVIVRSVADAAQSTCLDAAV